MSEVRRKDPRTFYENWLQVIILFAWIIGFLVFDFWGAILYVVIPQQFSAFSVFVFNYVQHIHTDEESDYNNSRNFMGVNWCLFNNGYHTAHHERANVHWSELKAEHAKVVDKIDPSLIEPTFLGFIFRVYILGSFNAKYKTFNMRQARIEREKQNPQAQNLAGA